MLGWWRRIQLKSGDPKVRQRAAQAIGKGKDRGAVDALIAMLGDPGGFSKDVNVYHPAPAAAWALGEIGDPKAVDPLIGALDSTETSEEAVAALAKIGAPAVDPLMKVVRDRSRRYRGEAALALGGVRDRRAVPALIELLRSRDSRYHLDNARAAHALGMIGDAAAVDALIEALSEDQVVLTEAAWALGEIGDPRAVAPLLKLNPSGRGGKAVAEALGKLPDPQTFARLIEQLADWDSDVRGQAEEALRSKGPAAAPVLIEALRSGKSTTGREVAARLLGEMKEPRALEALLEAAWDEDYPIRYEAVQALTRLGWQPTTEAEEASQLIVQRPVQDEELVRRLVEIGKPAVAPLIASLGYDNERGARGPYRAVMAKALGAIGDETAVQALSKAAADYNSILRREAVEALARIGPASVEPLLETLRYTTHPEDIMHALGAIGDQRALDALKRFAGAGYDKGVQLAAQEALKKLEKDG